MITRTDVLAHLEASMRVGFLKAGRSYTPLRSAFCEDVTSDGAFETYADMGAVPMPAQIGGQSGAQGTDGRTGAQQTGGLHEGGEITILGGNERSLVVYNQDWDIPIGIWHNAIDDNRVGNLDRWARSAGVRFEQHKDKLAFAALNAGAASTYGNCYDGQVLFSASHADPGAQYTTAQSNTNALALSLDNFETVYTAAGKYLDDRGEPNGLMPNLLIHAFDLKRTAVQITDNFDAYDTANRERNPYAGDFTRLSAPGGYLDTTAWFLVAGGTPEKPVNLQLRMSPQLRTWDDETQGMGVRYYKWVARYTIFYGDWRLITQGNT